MSPSFSPHFQLWEITGLCKPGMLCSMGWSSVPYFFFLEMSFFSFLYDWIKLHCVCMLLFWYPFNPFWCAIISMGMEASSTVYWLGFFYIGSDVTGSEGSTVSRFLRNSYRSPFPPVVHKPCPESSQACLFFLRWELFWLEWGWFYLCCFDLQSLMAKNVKHFFMLLLLFVLSIWNVTIQLICPFVD